MVTPEQKQKNQKYILDHLEEYVIDRNHNFVNVINHDLYGTDYFCISKGAVSNWELLSYWIAENIAKNKENWELIGFRVEDVPNPYFYPTGFKNKITGVEIRGLAIRPDDDSFLIGTVFGHREGAYENYDEWKEQSKIWREAVLNKNNSNSSQPQQSEPDQEEAEKIKKQFEETRKKTEEELKQRNQNQTNSNKDNNSIPPSNEKQQDQEFLKIINKAELLIKEKKFNSKILTKLISEKKKNSSLYQSLNKDGKIDKLVRELESIQQAKKNINKSVKNNRNNNKFPKEVIFISIFGIFLIIIGLGILVIKGKKKVKK